MYDTRVLRRGVVGLVLSVSFCIAEEPQVASHVSGYGFIEWGEIYKGIAVDQALDHVWLERAVIGTSINAVVNKHVRFDFTGEGEMAFSYLYDVPFADISTNATRQTRFMYYPTRGEGSYLFGDTARPFLTIGVGYFPFKYNPDARNLGEYLFRTRTYPNYIDNSFDKPFNRLLGVRIESTLFESLRQDLLLTSEANQYPLQDVSISYVAGYSLLKMFDIGAGIDFDRLFPAHPLATMPKNFNNLVIYRDTVKASDGVTDSVIADTSGYYTFGGTKLMVRIAFDPKPLFPSGIFGPSDLRIYGEAAVLGTKNYPRYYEDIWQRTPIMFGFNIPAFRVLDVATLEFEKFDSPWPNSYEVPFRTGNPLPYVQKSHRSFSHSEWRWSLFLERRIAGVFVIKAQFARDHLHPIETNSLRPETFDVLPQPDNWWWTIKVQYGF